ncbi:MAG: hypothetical protein M3R01_07825, partial [Actinomycetota bacterium]|nr:hypothetical protein [Actinomycetota bacterium]
MTMTSGVGRNADGRPVVVKEAGPGEEAEQLRAQAGVLTAAEHPGVVEVIELVALPDGGARLTTAFAGGSSLRRVRSTAALLPLLAATASTLADLHARGIVHGALDADHVLVSAADRTVLCGFAPDATGGAGADVAAFGALVAELVTEGHAGGTDGLRRIAERAAATPAPTMASVASMLAALHAPTPGPRASRRPRIPAWTGAALAGAVVVALIATLVLRHGAASDERSAAPSVLPG